MWAELPVCYKLYVASHESQPNLVYSSLTHIFPLDLSEAVDVYGEWVDAAGNGLYPLSPRASLLTMWTTL